MTFETNSEDKPSNTNIFNLGLDSKFYDVDEKILSPFSCLREFENHLIIGFLLPTSKLIKT